MKKVTKILEQPFQYRQMGLSFYDIRKPQIIAPWVSLFDLIQVATIWSSELENIKGY